MSTQSEWFPLPRPEGFIPSEEQSVAIKLALDNAAKENNQKLQYSIAGAYPLEFDEWMEELERGDRDWSSNP